MSRPGFKFLVPGGDFIAQIEVLIFIENALAYVRNIDFLVLQSSRIIF